MKTKFLSVFAILLSAFLVAGEGIPGQEAVGGSPIFKGVAVNKIDILFVVDSSGSMDVHQQALAANFATFIQLFREKSFDFHIGIITTDMDTWAGSRGQDGNLQGNPTVLDAAHPDLIAGFRANVLVGSAGSGAELGLDAIHRALSPAKLAAENAGFLREDAYLAVVVLSDENDNGSQATLADVNSALLALKPPVLVGGNARPNFSVSSIVSTDANAPGCGWSDPGLTYMALSGLTGGAILDLCSGNFGQQLPILITRLLEESTQVVVPGSHAPGSLHVTVGGDLLPESGWRFDADRQRILFDEISAPVRGAEIEVYVKEETR